MSSTNPRDTCSRCLRDDNLQRCSRCQSVWYCSSKCESAASKSHKPKCQILDGSDSPGSPPITSPVKTKFWTTLPLPPTSTARCAAGAPSSPSSSSSLQPPDVIQGVKITPDPPSSGTSPWPNSNLTSRGPQPRFINERFPSSHPFLVTSTSTQWELCPVTELYGIPILVLFELGGDDEKNNDNMKNSVALELCVGGFEGRGYPESWSMNTTTRQHNYTGNVFVVRKDKKPLTKETVETMYHFHVSLQLRRNSLEDGSTVFRLPTRNELTANDFRDFSEKYWTEEAAKLEQGRYKHSHSLIHRVFTNGFFKWK